MLNDDTQLNNIEQDSFYVHSEEKPRYRGGDVHILTNRRVLRLVLPPERNTVK